MSEAEKHFQFTAGEIDWMKKNPVVLAQLLTYHDLNRVELETLYEPDDLDPWPSARYTQLYERARSIMAEDLDCWSNWMRTRFGFPPYGG